MIDNSQKVFDSVAQSIRTTFGAFVVGRELNDAPPHFPALSIVQRNNSVNTKCSTFEKIEVAAIEEYQIEAFSNLQEGREQETKDIMAVVDEIMANLGYVRTFCKPIPNAVDTNVARLCARYKNNYVI